MKLTIILTEALSLFNEIQKKLEIVNKIAQALIYQSRLKSSNCGIKHKPRLKEQPKPTMCYNVFS